MIFSLHTQSLHAVSLSFIYSGNEKTFQLKFIVESDCIYCEAG